MYYFGGCRTCIFFFLMDKFNSGHDRTEGGKGSEKERRKGMQVRAKKGGERTTGNNMKVLRRTKQNIHQHTWKKKKKTTKQNMN